MSGSAACSEAQHIKIVIAVFDDRLAVYTARLDENRGLCWSLYVLNWQRHSQTDVGLLSFAVALVWAFMLPVLSKLVVFDYPSIFYSAASCAGLAVPVDHWIWTTNPADIPSTGLIRRQKMGAQSLGCYGVHNSCFVPEERFGREGWCLFGVGGSHVVWASSIADRTGSSFQLHMADFLQSFGRGMRHQQANARTYNLISRSPAGHAGDDIPPFRGGVP
jgi:hypothetical protein